MIRRKKLAKALRTVAVYVEIDYVQYGRWLLASAKKTWIDAKRLCKNEFQAYKKLHDHAFELRNIEDQFMASPAQILKDRTWNRTT